MLSQVDVADNSLGTLARDAIYSTARSLVFAQRHEVTIYTLAHATEQRVDSRHTRNARSHFTVISWHPTSMQNPRRQLPSARR